MCYNDMDMPLYFICSLLCPIDFNHVAWKEYIIKCLNPYIWQKKEISKERQAAIKLFVSSITY